MHYKLKLYMEKQEYRQVIQKLYIMTKSNEKVWTRTNLISQFSVESGKGRINIIYNDQEQIVLGPVPPIYQLLILNENNEIIDSVDSDGPHKNNEMYELLDKLWKEIVDQYYKKTETITSIKEDLGIE